MVTEPSSELWGVLGIITSIAVGGLVYVLEWKRKNRINKDHKKIIGNHMNELNEIVSQVMIDVNQLDEDEISVSERLNKFLIKKYHHIESLINNIKLHQIQCSKLSKEETDDIDNIINVSRWILDKYSPQDVSESRRVNLWKNNNHELKTQVGILSNSVNRFRN